MATATADQVIVGRLPLPQAGGQLSLFQLPKSFGWLKHFNAEEMAGFFSELLEALHSSQQDDNWSAVQDVVGAWQATAEIKADPVLAADIETGLEELAEGQTTDWATLREELDL